MQLKTCSDCGIEKELSEFYNQNRHSKKRGKYIYHNPECKNCTFTRTIKWQKENPEKKKKYQRNFVETRSYRVSLRKTSESPERKLYMKEYQRKNKDKMKNYSEQHRNHEISDTEWLNCKEYFNNECAYCGLHISEHFIKYAGEMRHTDLHKEHVDHLGANDLSNCAPSCKSCNGMKWIFSLDEWYTKDNEFHNGFSEEKLNKLHKWINGDYKLYKES